MRSVPAAHKIFNAARDRTAEPPATADAAHAIGRWAQRLPRPLVFTNGCFDVVHPGHTEYLERAAALGAALVVGINSDASVRRQDKGADRPIIPLANRMAVVAAFAAVDGVIAFAETTPRELIDCLRPDHLVKGGDWATDQIIGGDAVIARGGQVHAIPLSVGAFCSSTAILQRIRAPSSGSK